MRSPLARARAHPGIARWNSRARPREGGFGGGGRPGGSLPLVPVGIDSSTSAEASCRASHFGHPLGTLQSITHLRRRLLAFARSAFARSGLRTSAEDMCECTSHVGNIVESVGRMAWATAFVGHKPTPSAITPRTKHSVHYLTL